MRILNVSSDVALNPKLQAIDPGLNLPDAVVSPYDFGQIQRELHALDQFLTASKASSKLPFVSPALQSVMKATSVNPLSADDRMRLANQLLFVRRTAPVVQISFASEPSKQALRPIVRWFRQNGHSNTLLSVGVQPKLAGGCVVRTASKEFDFSLQQMFTNHKAQLAEVLKK